MWGYGNGLEENFIASVFLFLSAGKWCRLHRAVSLVHDMRVNTPETGTYHDLQASFLCVIVVVEVSSH